MPGIYYVILVLDVQLELFFVHQDSSEDVVCPSQMSQSRSANLQLEE
jgi:hypothetical protein